VKQSEVRKKGTVKQEGKPTWKVVGSDETETSDDRHFWLVGTAKGRGAIDGN